MKPCLQRIVVALVCTALCACTSIRTLPVDSGSGHSNTADFRPENQLAITLKTGEVYRMRFASSDTTAITGTELSAGARMVVPWVQIARIEHREVSVARTTGLVVVVAAAAVLLLYMLGSALTTGATAGALAGAQ